MHEIMEQFGMAVLQMTAVVGVAAVLFNCVGDGGTLSLIVAEYMKSICG